MHRSNLSCCVIVKNEQDKIASFLSNISKCADEIVVVDTGSTDNTINIIEKFKSLHKNTQLHCVNSRFHDDDGDFDFGKAKTFALQQSQSDFVMWLDVNDKIMEPEKLKSIFIQETNKNKNVYFALPTAVTDKHAYIRNRIGPRNTSVVIGRVHEYMTYTNIDILTRIFIPISIQNFKQTRDLNRNLRLLLKEWEREPSSRIAFYLGMTYRELTDLPNAYKWFLKRIYTFEFIEEFAEEYYKALESVCELVIDMGTPIDKWGDLLDNSKTMIEKEPTRIEGYYYLCKYYLLIQDIDNAVITIRKRHQCKKPESYKLWLNPIMYNGKAITNIVDDCKMALNNRNVLKPDQILDLNNFHSTHFY